MWACTYLDYADVIYHKAEENNEPFYIFYRLHDIKDFYMNQIEQIQYEAARVITGAWKGTSREILYNILG